MLVKARFLPATSHHGAMVRATASNGASLTIPHPNADDSYARVVAALGTALYHGKPFAVTHLDGNRWDVSPYHTEGS